MAPRTIDNGRLIDGEKLDNLPADVTAELSLKEDKANKGIANGYASLDGTGKVPTGQLPEGMGSGDVTGPASSTDNALARMDGLTGKIIQNSNILIDDNDNMSGIAKAGLDTGAGATVSTGEIAWNSTEGTADLGLNENVTLQLGQESNWFARNNTGDLIPNGTTVYASGTLGASGRITIAKYISDGSIAGLFNLGVVTEDIADGTDGYVTHFGKVRGLDTTGIPEGEVWADGDVLYPSAITAGILTKVEPISPNISIPLAFIVYSHVTNGTLAVRVPTPNQRGLDVNLNATGSSTYRTVQDMQNTFHSAGFVTPQSIVDAGGGNITVATGSTGFIRATNSPIAQLLFTDCTGLASTAIPTDTTRYIGVDYNAGAPTIVVHTTYDWNYNTNFPLGNVVNEGGVLHIETSAQEVGDHASLMLQRIYGVNGIQRDNRIGGIILSETGTRNIAVSGGILWDRLTPHPFSSFDSSVTGSTDFYYNDGGSGFNKDAARTTWNNTQYDDGTGTLATLVNNKYSHQDFYVELDGGVIGIYGGTYNSSADAESSPLGPIPDRVSIQGIFIGRIVFQKSAATALEIFSAFSVTFTSALASSHPNLTNLAWTISGHTGTASSLAGFDGAGVANHILLNTLVTLTGTQTLTNKTFTSPVINTPTGIVKGDVGLGNVDNTSDANKPVSTATQTALDLKANLISPTFTGVPLTTAPTVDLSIATKKYVDDSITVTPTNTVTLTNKRITERTNTIASSATPTPAGDTTDLFTVTALAVAATFAAPTGTPTEGQVLLIRIKDNATARALTWNAIYRASTDLALPTTTIISKTLYLQFVYNSTDSKWDMLGLLDNI